MHFNRQTFGKTLLSVLWIGLALLFLSGPSHAIPIASSTGTASIDYNSIIFTFNGVASNDGVASGLNWFDLTDPANPLDTRASFSGTAATLNGYIDPYVYSPGINYIDGGPWGNTSDSKALSDLTGSVTGSAYTNYPLDPFADPTLPSLFSSADMNLTTFGFGSLDMGQSVFSGDFTVLTPGTLTVTANFQLSQLLAVNAGPRVGRLRFLLRRCRAYVVRLRDMIRTRLTDCPCSPLTQSFRML